MVYVPSYLPTFLYKRSSETIWTILSVSAITNSPESPVVVCRCDSQGCKSRFLLWLLRFCCLNREDSRAPPACWALRGQESKSPRAVWIRLTGTTMLSFLSSRFLCIHLGHLGILLIFVELLLAPLPLNSDSNLVIRKRQAVSSLQALQDRHARRGCDKVCVLNFLSSKGQMFILLFSLLWC